MSPYRTAEYVERAPMVCACGVAHDTRQFFRRGDPIVLCAKCWGDEFMSADDRTRELALAIHREWIGEVLDWAGVVIVRT